MFRNANFSNLVWGVIARGVRLVSWWTGWCLQQLAVDWSSAWTWRPVYWTSLIYACKHAETIKKQHDRQASSFSSSQPSFTVLYAPVCLSSTLWNIKKITWAQHCSKWQANALGISKKTLRVRTYIYRRRSRLQTTIYSFSVFDFFFFFSFLFIVTCHMRSLDYKSTWTNCLYISMHSCFLIYILFTDSNEEEKDQPHVSFHVFHFHFLDGEQKAWPYRFAECRGHAHQIEYLLEGANVLFINCGCKKKKERKEKGVKKKPVPPAGFVSDRGCCIA